MTQYSLFDILPKEDKDTTPKASAVPCFEINGAKIFPEFEGSDVWMSSKESEQLFNKSKSTISEHINKLEIKEWSKNSPHSTLLPQVRNFRTSDNVCGGIHKSVKKYNLATIIQLGFKLK